MTILNGPWTEDEFNCICLPNGRAIIHLNDIGGESEEEITVNKAAILNLPEIVRVLAVSTIRYVDVYGNEGADAPDVIKDAVAVLAKLGIDPYNMTEADTL